MTEKLPITVGYNRVLAALMTVSAVFILGVAALTGKLFPQALTGFVILALAVGYWTQTAMVVGTSEVELKNLFGRTVQRFPFSNASELSLKDGRLYIGAEKVGLPRWLLRGSDVDALARALG